MWNNCYAWAHLRERELWRQWERMGKPLDRVPCIQRRPSRLDPDWVRHWVVGWWCYATRTLEDVESFVPDSKDPLPWYRLWQGLLFSGHIKHGDTPTEPPEP